MRYWYRKQHPLYFRNAMVQFGLTLTQLHPFYAFFSEVCLRRSVSCAADQRYELM